MGRNFDMLKAPAILGILEMIPVPQAMGNLCDMPSSPVEAAAPRSKASSTTTSLSSRKRSGVSLHTFSGMRKECRYFLRLSLVMEGFSDETPVHWSHIAVATWTRSVSIRPW